jgi:hypothetical protein
VFSCRGLYKLGLEEPVAIYLMLGHNLMHVSPCLLQHLVSERRFG